VVVKENGRAVNPRTYSVIGGLTLGPRELLVNGKSITTLHASIVERVFYCVKHGEVKGPLRPLDNVFGTLLKFKKKVLFSFGLKPTRLTPEEFVDLYKGRKRTIYDNALPEFYNGVKHSHARLSAFVKAEKVKEGSPRAIQPRSPVYNIGLGVYLKHIEHTLYRSIARVYGQKMVVSKGYNVVDLGERIAEMWYEIEDPCFVGFDASRFDMHVSVDALQWEHSIYLALYDYDPELARLLRMQLTNYGVGYCDDGKIKYRVDGRRMSGDMNTALGNCLIACAIVHAFMNGLRVPYRFINNGDDCGVIVNREDVSLLDGISHHFELFGFRLEVEQPVYELEHLEFCQMNPVFDGSQWRMVRKIKTALQKDTMSLIPFNSPKLLRKWLYSVGECGLALCSGIPVMQAFYRLYMMVGIPSNINEATYMECGARQLARGLAACEVPITDEARYSFYVATGITPLEQVGLEEYYSSFSDQISYNEFDDYIPYYDSLDILN
jgi:hypothetical protein